MLAFLIILLAFVCVVSFLLLGLLLTYASIDYAMYAIHDKERPLFYRILNIVVGMFGAAMGIIVITTMIILVILI